MFPAKDKNRCRTLIALAALAWTIPGASVHAQERTLTLTDGLDSGANFEIRWDAPPPAPCVATTDHPNPGSTRSVSVTLDCGSSSTGVGPGVTAEFVLFDGVQLKPGWSVKEFSTARGAGDAGSFQVLQNPLTGGTNPKIRIRLQARTGIRIRVGLTLKIGFVDPLPACASAAVPPPPSFVCTAISDCSSDGSILCSAQCGMRCIAK